MELGMWKKLFKGWTASFEVWSEAARGTEERRTASRRRRRTGWHWYWGREAVLGSGNPRAQISEADGKAYSEVLAKKKKKGELGSGKPYDDRSEVEVTLDIPVVS
jgi:hypothetical protein